MGVDLTDFGVTTRPRIMQRSAVHLGPRTVGHVAYDTANGAHCYVSERNSDDHRYHGTDPRYDLPFGGDGFGLSLDLFEQIHGRGIGRVYIVEPDTETVYHFSFGQFVDGAHINTERESAGRGYEKDHQQVVPISCAIDQWDIPHGDVYAKQPAFR